MGALRSALALSVAVAIGTGAVVFYVPGSAPAPLVGPLGWNAVGAFEQNARPGLDEVARSIVEDPGARFFRSWRPVEGSGPGRVESPEFAPGRRFWVPIVGYPTADRIDVFVECLSNRNRLPVATGDSHETWVQRLVRVPSGWCSGRARLVAVSDSRRDYVGIGTPYSASSLDEWRRALPTQMFLHGLAFFPLIGLFVGCALLSSACPLGRAREVAIAASALGVAGYLAFFAAWRGLSPLWPLILVAPAALAVFLGRARGHRVQLRLPTGFTQAIVAWYGLSLGLQLIVVGANVGAGPWDANSVFAPAIWSTDHLLPSVVSEALYQHRPVAGALGGGWHVSDRPPLQAGLLLLERPVWHWVVPAYRSAEALPILRSATGIVAQSSAVVAAFVFARGILRSYRGWQWAVLAALFSPFFLFNSVYTWPKLLSAAYALIGASLLWALARESRAAERLGAAALAGVLFGLSMLAHAGVAVGLLALPIVFFLVQGRWRVVEMALAALVAFVVMLPWTQWQRHVDPPGNALTKYGLAGTFDFEHPERSVTEAVVERYRGLDTQEWVGTRIDALKTMIGSSTPASVQWVQDGARTPLGRLRVSDFLFILPAMRVLIVPLFWPLWLRVSAAPRKPGQPELIRVWSGLIAGAGAGLLINALLMWDNHTALTQSYLTLTLIYLAAACGMLLMTPMARAIVIALQAAYTAIVWVAAPFSNHDVLVPTLIAGMVAMAAAGGVASFSDRLRPSAAMT
jgi:hypothetical protein